MVWGSYRYFWGVLTWAMWEPQSRGCHWGLGRKSRLCLEASAGVSCADDLSAPTCWAFFPEGLASGGKWLALARPAAAL